ncbi:hypothetical protein PGQ11_001715 [Apiospora arundinis]|uniref:Mid2 domain-containing protein n=1 Tax=Apiospora arundinis TaxID=335852 RepID=A0ABR2JFT6_9PEZI
MAEQQWPVADLGIGEGHRAAAEKLEDDTTTDALAAIKQHPKEQNLVLQVRQLSVGRDNRMLTSEITSPSPFPSGTPATLITAPPPPSTQTEMAIPTSFTTSIAFRSISSPPSPSYQHSHSPDPAAATMAAATAAAASSTTGIGEEYGGGADGSDGGDLSNSASPNSGLSTAAAAGIGVGSTVGGVLLLILVGWFVQRRKRLAPTASRAYDRPLKDDSAAVSSEGAAATEAGTKSGGSGGIEMSFSSKHPALRTSGGGGAGGGTAVMAEDRV